MAISQQEFESILMDASKEVVGDIVWIDDVDHSPAKEFRVEVHTDDEYGLFVVGRYNPFSGKLTYCFILRGVGRIYGLDLGRAHRNPDGVQVGEKHKHRWRHGALNRFAYEPDDITETWDHPRAVWEQYCAEAQLRHNGMMLEPEVREELPL